MQRVMLLKSRKVGVRLYGPRRTLLIDNPERLGIKGVDYVLLNPPVIDPAEVVEQVAPEPEPEPEPKPKPKAAPKKKAAAKAKPAGK